MAEPTAEYIAEIRLPITATSLEAAENVADRIVARFEEVRGRDVYLDNVRLMEGETEPEGDTVA